MALTPVRISPPSKGWNTVSPIREMSSDYAVRLENVWLDQHQSMNRRAGQRILDLTPPTAGQSVKHMFEHNNSTNGTSKLFAWVSGEIKEWVTVGTWTVVDSSMTSRIRHAALGNITVVGDGISAPKHFNGTAWNPVGTLPSTSSVLGNIFHTHKARTYAAGDPSNRMLVHYSDVIGNDGVDYWGLSLGGTGGIAKGGFINVAGAISEGDEIVGLTSYKGFLVVFLRNHIVFYEGSDPEVGGLSVSKVISGIGCLTQDSIQGIGNNTMFLSRYGFKTLEQIAVQGDAAAKNSSVPINNYVIEQLRIGTVSEVDIRSEFVEEWGVYLCNMGNVTLAYHVFFDAWVSWYGIQPQLLKRLDGTVLVCGEYLHEMSTRFNGDTVGASSEVAIPMVWELPPIRSEGAEIKSRWNRVELIFEAPDNETVDVITWINLDESQAISETITLHPSKLVISSTNMIWSSVPTTDPRRLWGSTWAGSSTALAGSEKVPIIGRSELLSIRVENRNISDFKITAVEAYYNSGGLRE